MLAHTAPISIELFNKFGATRDFNSVLDTLLLYRNIVNLDLGGNMITDGFCDQLCKGMIAYGCEVQNFILSGNNLTAGAGVALGSFLAYNSSVMYLNLRLNNLGNEGAGPLANGLKLNRSVTYLNLSTNSLGPVGAKALGEGLAANGKIKNLDLSGNPLGEPGISALARGLWGTSLRALNLAATSLPSAAAPHVATLLQYAPGMMELVLAINALGDQGACALATVLASNPTLKRLDLSENNIYESGAVAIAQCLTSNNNLSYLNLKNNRINNTGCMALANVFLRQPHLVFNLVGNHITEKENMYILQFLKERKRYYDNVKPTAPPQTMPKHQNQHYKPPHMQPASLPSKTSPLRQAPTPPSPKLLKHPTSPNQPTSPLLTTGQPVNGNVSPHSTYKKPAPSPPSALKTYAPSKPQTTPTPQISTPIQPQPTTQEPNISTAHMQTPNDQSTQTSQTSSPPSSPSLSLSESTPQFPAVSTESMPNVQPPQESPAKAALKQFLEDPKIMSIKMEVQQMQQHEEDEEVKRLTVNLSPTFIAPSDLPSPTPRETPTVEMITDTKREIQELDSLKSRLGNVLSSLKLKLPPQNGDSVPNTMSTETMDQREPIAQPTPKSPPTPKQINLSSDDDDSSNEEEQQLHPPTVDKTDHSAQPSPVPPQILLEDDSNDKMDEDPEKDNPLITIHQELEVEPVAPSITPRNGIKLELPFHNYNSFPLSPRGRNQLDITNGDQQQHNPIVEESDDYVAGGDYFTYTHEWEPFEESTQVEVPKLESGDKLKLLIEDDDDLSSMVITRQKDKSVRSPGLSQEEFLDQNYVDNANDWQSESFSDNDSVNGLLDQVVTPSSSTSEFVPPRVSQSSPAFSASAEAEVSPSVHLPNITISQANSVHNSFFNGEASFVVTKHETRAKATEKKVVLHITKDAITLKEKKVFGKKELRIHMSAAVTTHISMRAMGAFTIASAQLPEPWLFSSDDRELIMAVILTFAHGYKPLAQKMKELGMTIRSK